MLRGLDSGVGDIDRAAFSVCKYGIAVGSVSTYLGIADGEFTAVLGNDCGIGSVEVGFVATVCIARLGDTDIVVVFLGAVRIYGVLVGVGSRILLTRSAL